MRLPILEEGRPTRSGDTISYLNKRVEAPKRRGGKGRGPSSREKEKEPEKKEPAEERSFPSLGEKRDEN